MARVRSIDLFRGIAILLMVLFTLMNVLTIENGFFDHNEQGAVHPGDFVLPLFLFASGLSIPFFWEKHSAKGRDGYIRDVLKRFGLLFGISMLLSPASAGSLLGMDEVSLSALLFLFTVSAIAYLAIFGMLHSAIVIAAYLALLSAGMTTIFDGAYLGGYLAVPFYLPVMLAGAWLGTEIRQKRSWRGGLLLLGVSLFATAMLVSAIPIDKMRASPSFMSASIAVSAGIFLAVDFLAKKGVSSAKLEYLGKKPILYWVLMFAFFVIPFGLSVRLGFLPYPLGMPLLPALAFTTIFMAFIAVVARLLADAYERVISGLP